MLNFEPMIVIRNGAKPLRHRATSISFPTVPGNYKNQGLPEQEVLQYCHSTQKFTVKQILKPMGSGYTPIIFWILLKSSLSVVWHMF